MLFDTHCHLLDRAFDGNRAAVIQAIEASEIKYVTEIGLDYESSKAVLDFAEKHGFAFAAIGWFPDETERLTEELLGKTMELFRSPRAVAIGEIGLDYHYEDGADHEVQRYWFKRQLEEAFKLKAPVCIHSRDADADTMSILKDCGMFSKERYDSFAPLSDGSPDARVLLHCYSGSAELAKQYVKLGATISLAGPLTFKNARKAVETAEAVPLERLVVETDSPYMAPVPHRGEQNNPTLVEFTARKLAEIKGISYDAAASATFANACRFYGI